MTVVWVKQSTAVVISFGPFLDNTDGVTEETGLVSALDHATTGIKLAKNGGALTIRHATVTATTYDAWGYYRVTLDTTDTNTLGLLLVAFNEAATCLPVWLYCGVLPANVYDSLVGGSDTLDVAVTSIGANVITAASIAADAITDAKVASDVTIASVTGAVGSVTGAVGSVTGAVGSVTGAVGSVTGNVGGNVVGSVGSVTGLTNTTIEAAIWDADPSNHEVAGTFGPILAAAAQEATLTAMKGATFAGATDSLEAIRDRGDAAWATATGFSTLDAAGVRTAVGLASANLDTQLTAIDDLIDTEVGAIKTKTDYLPSATAGAAGGLFIAGANAATSITGALTANITGSMSGNVEGNVNGSVGSVVGNVGGNVTGSVGSVVGFTPSNIADIISTLGNPSEPTMSGDIAAARAALADIKGATFDTATDSLEAIRDRGDAAWDTATGFSTLDAAGVRTAVGLASANLDTQLTAIDDLIDTEVGAIYTRLGAPAGASIAADIAGITATVDAADIRAAIGLASANLDAQLADLPTAAENADANWDEARSGHVAAGSFGEGVKVNSIEDGAITADSIDYGAIQDDKIHNATYNEMGAKAAQLTWQSLSADYAPAGGFYVADSMGEQMTHLDADVSSAGGGLDAAGVRAAIGMASANLDTQLSAIDDLLDTEVAAIYNRIGAPVGASISADIAGITATVDAADIRAAIGMAAANLDTQLAALPTAAENADANWDEALAGHAGAGSTGLALDDVLGYGASTIADIASARAVVDTINTNTTAAAQRAAVGLATANLDTQLTAIDDLVDTEVAAIYTRLGAPVGASISADIATVDAVADAIKAWTDAGVVASVTGAVGSVTAGVTVTTNNDKTGYTLTSGERNSVADALLDRTDGATSGYTFREALEVLLSAMAGKVSGAGTVTVTFRDINDTKNVIVATVDTSGNRSAVTVAP